MEEPALGISRNRRCNRTTKRRSWLVGWLGPGASHRQGSTCTVGARVAWGGGNSSWILVGENFMMMFFSSHLQFTPGNSLISNPTRCGGLLSQGPWKKPRPSKQRMSELRSKQPSLCLLKLPDSLVPLPARQLNSLLKQSSDQQHENNKALRKSNPCLDFEPIPKQPYFKDIQRRSIPSLGLCRGKFPPGFPGDHFVKFRLGLDWVRFDLIRCDFI